MSGILPVQYERFTNALGIGTLSDHKQSLLVKEYAEVVAEVTKKSYQYSLSKEEELTTDLPPKSLRILADARHNRRKISWDCHSKWS